MVGTISPAVCRSVGDSSWRRLISIYSIAQVAGAAVTGLTLSVAAGFLHEYWVWDPASAALAIGGVVGIAALVDLKVLDVRLPNRNWQVPQGWKRLAPSVMAAAYGFGIGVGVLTRIPFAGFHAVLFAIVALADIPTGVGIMMLYGAARSATVAWIAYGQRSDVMACSRRLDQIASLSPLARFLEGLLLSFIASLLIGSALFGN